MNTLINQIRIPRLAMCCLTLVLLVLAALPARAAESITYYHWDALGSPVAATDETGNVKWREEYMPYGARIQNQTAAQSNSRWFTGHPHDEATGLTYMGARWYDPVVGRFMGVDPKDFSEGNVHSFNRYTYSNNNPYKYVDPDGRSSVAVQGAVGGFEGGTFVCGPICGIIGGVGGFLGGAYLTDKAWNYIHSQSSDSNDEREEKPNLVEPDRAKHILDGDKSSGGHRAGTGKPEKSEFPSDWSDDRVLGEISDVATAPDSSRSPARGGREFVRGTRGGVDIEVIVDPNGQIVTGYPTNVPRNP